MLAGRFPNGCREDLHPVCVFFTLLILLLEPLVLPLALIITLISGL